MPTLYRDVEIQFTSAGADDATTDYATHLEADGSRRRYAAQILNLARKRAALVAAGQDTATIDAAIAAAKTQHDNYAATAKTAGDSLSARITARIAASPYASATIAGWRHNVADGSITLLGVDDQSVVGAIVRRLAPLVQRLRAEHPDATRAELLDLVRLAILLAAKDKWDDAV
jgi:hypothetical protein